MTKMRKTHPLKTKAQVALEAMTKSIHPISHLFYIGYPQGGTPYGSFII
ncbi:hypothetical protein MNBD_GAMMA01-1444 [hydrothermal vent metagenome]|uniref:Uncharacterized protein n=1 Tax=hydrothermal vent metagenome TaxID=652676 RepID=A0A3B0VXW0_9ZZZZ